MCTAGLGDVDLRGVGWEEGGDFGDGGNFQGGSDDDDEVGFLSVVVDEPVVEGLGEVFAEEGDVGLCGPCQFVCGCWERM